MMRNHDYIVQERYKEEFDKQCLHKPLFPVNMRLFESSKFYKKHILDIIDYMDWTMKQKWEDYISNSDGGTYGISCANLGMAYNIIGFKPKVNEECRYLINPEIIVSSEKMILTQSNCGSIKFSQKIPVLRHAYIKVLYYGVDGKYWNEGFTGKNGGFTIQHEIDHNLGILITDRYLQQGGDPNLLNNI